MGWKLFIGGREIRDLRVKCDNVESGCHWTGTVGTINEHLITCQFTPVSCPNKCGDKTEQFNLIKKDLEIHLKTKCPNRAYRCQHCGKKGTYTSITNGHDKVCGKKKDPCPNNGCPLLMERRTIEQHVRSVCDYTEVACPFENLGCGARMQQKYVKEHKNEARERHMDLALETLSLREAQHNTLSEGEAVMFKLTGYANKKEKKEIFFSNPFYTSTRGYKMCIRVDANGDGAGKDTHLSVFTKLLPGCYDDQLRWPFRGAVEYVLLNQLSDTKHFSRVSSFGASVDMHLNTLWGYPKYFSHSSLHHNHATNTQYLMEDSLYFRVTVKVNYKSWLACNEKMFLSFVRASKDCVTMTNGEAMVFKVPAYTFKKATDEHFYSNPFYTSADGYKMCIEIYPNGDGSGKATHLSIYAKLLEGVNDVSLPWPFMGTVTFALLNQLADENHHTWILQYKVSDNAGVGSSWGKPRFISLSGLYHNPVKKTWYLKSDELYFRVAVKVSNHKPWLVCTSHH